MGDGHLSFKISNKPMADKQEGLREQIEEHLVKECGLAFEVDFNSMRCSRCGELIDSDLNSQLPMTIPEFNNEMLITALRHYLNDCEE